MVTKAAKPTSLQRFAPMDCHAVFAFLNLNPKPAQSFGHG
jgi:hypothetical protein